MNWRPSANALLSALFEPPCAACGVTLRHPLNGAVCEACWHVIATAPAPPLRRDEPAMVDVSAAVGEYDGRLRDVIHALKYDRRRSIAPRLGALMRTAGAAVIPGAEAAVPVPLHRRRRRARGFNQAEDLALAIGLPVRHLLRRHRPTAPQVDLPAGERHRNVRDAFGLRPSAFGLQASAMRLPAVVVLVDDVSTTGATLEACARVLKGAGVAEVRALTAARVSTARR